MSRPLGSSVVFLVLLASSCSTPFIPQQPLTVGAEPPVEIPSLSITLDGTPVPETEPSGLLFRGKLTYTDYAAGEGLEGGAEAERPVLVLEFTSADPQRVLTLRLAMAPDLVPDLDRGSGYGVRVYLLPADPFSAVASGLVLRSDSGQLLYLLNSNDAVPDSESPAGIGVAQAQKVAFYTTTVSRSGCTLSEVHRFAAIDSQGRTAHVAPGESREFRGVSGRYQVFVLDNSTSTAEAECQAESLPHFTYVVAPSSAKD